MLGEPLPITPERIRPGSQSTAVSLVSTWSAWRSECWSWYRCCLRKGGDTSCPSPGTAPDATSATFAWAQLGPRWWKDKQVSRGEYFPLLWLDCVSSNEWPTYQGAKNYFIKVTKLSLDRTFSHTEQRSHSSQWTTRAEIPELQQKGEHRESFIWYSEGTTLLNFNGNIVYALWV